MRYPKALLLLLLLTGASAVAETPGDAYFEVQVAGEGKTETFVLQLFDPALIQQARDIISGKQTEAVAVMGTLVKAPAFFNQPWHFHVDPASVSFFSMATEVCDSSISGIENHLDEVGQALLPNNVWCPWQSKVTRELPRPAEAGNAVYVTSGASYSQAALAPGAIVSIYGRDLTDRAERASSADLPLSLAGISAEIRAANQQAGRKLPLYFASPSQINAVLPRDLPSGEFTISVVRSRGAKLETAVHIENVAPALFFFEQYNKPFAAATLLRVRPDGTRSTETLVSIDPTTGAAVPVPIQLGSGQDQLYLSLYGTGLHGAGTGAVSVSIGSEEAPVLFAGEQGGSPGLDQINVQLPRTLTSGPNELVQVSVNTASGNPVRANLVHILVGAARAASAAATAPPPPPVAAAHARRESGPAN